MRLIGRDTWVIAKREFLSRVRTKWFVIGTVLGPIGMLLLILVPALLATTGGEQTKLEIVDRSGVLGPALVDGFSKLGWHPEIVPTDVPQATLLARIRDKRINGYLDIPADALDDGETVYRGDNASSTAVIAKIAGTVTAAAWRIRGAHQHISSAAIDDMLRPVRVASKHTTGETEASSGLALFFIGYAMTIIVYFSITLYAVNVMSSVVQEKTSRVIELMVAAAKPRALMAGKILGVGSAGLLQLSAWLCMGVLTLRYRDAMLGTFGASTAGATLPSLAVGQIVVVLVYFVLGYFFYASLFAAVGAMVSTEEEAKQAQMPVTLLLLIPMGCIQVVANDPRATPAEVLTMFPFSSPILMPMRYLLGGASLVQVAISLAVLAASTIVVVRAASKIYRVGILLYGKRPTVRELWRWVRY